MVNKQYYYRTVSMLCCLCILLLSVTGCTTLRKKFTRQKKKDRTEKQEVAILEPIIYPAKVQTTAQVYQYHYSLWQVWQKELITALEIRESIKRTVYHLDNVIVNLEEMQALLTGEKKDALTPYLKTLYRCKGDLEAPVASMSLASWKTKLQSIERNIRRDYVFRKIKESIAP